MPDGVILGDRYTALMFVATKSFSEKQENKIKGIIDKELGKSIQFVGRCFGKYDIIVEFREESSAKVASYKACNMQEEASKMMWEKTPKDYKIKDSICSSLVLCREFIKTDGMKKSSIKGLPIRFYSLFVPKNIPINLDQILGEVKDNMGLFFSSSYFAFLLVISGNNFYNVFDDFSKFRESTKEFFLESSTYVAIDWKKEDIPSDKKKIEANVFLKLKDGFGNIEDIVRDDFIRSKYKRFGSFDFSLLVEDETLWEMKRKILKLRELYGKKIAHTTTSLLIEEVKNGADRQEL
jgi:hypothetical protein